jgi:hypothetical protein
MLAGVGMGHRPHDAVEPAALQQVGGERVEQTGARGEDQVDGRAGDRGTEAARATWSRLTGSDGAARRRS